MCRSQVNQPLVDAGFIKLINLRKEYAKCYGAESFTDMALEDGDLSGEIFKDWKDEVKKALPKTLEKKAAYAEKYLGTSDLRQWDSSFLAGFSGHQKALPKSKVSRFLSPKLFLYGWGMNYRTKLFDEFSFDESFRGWCLDDIEIGLRISKSHLNVQRTDAITDHVRISRGHTCPLRLIAMMLQYSYLLKKNEVNESTWKRFNNYLALTQKLELKIYSKAEHNPQIRSNTWNLINKLTPIIENCNESAHGGVF